jgi:hypothetical protein
MLRPTAVSTAGGKQGDACIEMRHTWVGEPDALFTEFNGGWLDDHSGWQRAGAGAWTMRGSVFSGERLLP